MRVLRLSSSSTLSSSRLIALERAGRWFLESGIQERTGGVARYYLSDSQQNAPVSTEITGYAVSTLVYLWNKTGDERYIQAARRAAHYLVDDAWDEGSATFPFEPVLIGYPGYTYFFDCGIIVRGLLSLWRVTEQPVYLERAKQCGQSMAVDFVADSAIDPVLELPHKRALPHGHRWSHRPGCYQLKSALAWLELARSAGEPRLAAAFERELQVALVTDDSFLPGDPEDRQVMDRLHAYAYFLEALLAVADRPGVAAALNTGIVRLAGHLHRIAPEFARSDVYAQLLRVRLFADRLGVRTLDVTAATAEASSLAAFQVDGSDPRIAGGFYFGRKQGAWMPFVNPVSTAFALQALGMWQEYQNGGVQTPVLALI